MVIRETNVDNINGRQWQIGPADDDVKHTAVIVRQRHNTVHQAVRSKVVLELYFRCRF